MTIAVITTCRADWATMGEVAKAIAAVGEHVTIMMAADHAGAEEVRTSGLDVLTYGIADPLTPGLGEIGQLLERDGLALSGLGSSLATFHPRIVLVCGDRHEALQATFCAALMGIPVGHIAGGDISGGSLDERWRHAMTKMADLHFATSEQAASVITQMGEPGDRVWAVGSPSIDKLVRHANAPLGETTAKLDLIDSRPFWLVNWQAGVLSDREFPAVLQALASSQWPAVFVGLNGDPGARSAEALLMRWIAEGAGRGNGWRVFAHLPHGVYLDALYHCRALIGNSSSGYYEAPFYGTPVIDVGTRQSGRQGRHPLKCIQREPADARAITVRMWEIEQRKFTHYAPEYPYGRGGAAQRIAEIVRDYAPSGHSKRFVRQ